MISQKNQNLYLVNFEFKSGEYEQEFHRLFYAKNGKEVDKQIHKYLKDYYGDGNTSEIDGDVYYYCGGEIAVNYSGWEEITDTRQIINRLLY